MSSISASLIFLDYYKEYLIRFEKLVVSKFVKYFKIRWFCEEKVKIKALKGKLFNFNENNENHKVYPSACDSSYETLLNAPQSRGAPYSRSRWRSFTNRNGTD
jgi:hypothetical protein